MSNAALLDVGSGFDGRLLGTRQGRFDGPLQTVPGLQCPEIADHGLP